MNTGIRSKDTIKLKKIGRKKRFVCFSSKGTNEAQYYLMGSCEFQGKSPLLIFSLFSSSRSEDKNFLAQGLQDLSRERVTAATSNQFGNPVIIGIENVFSSVLDKV